MAITPQPSPQPQTEEQHPQPSKLSKFMQPPLPSGGIGIGIETELLLKARNPSSHGNSLPCFAKKLGLEYNEFVGNNHPHMSTRLNQHAPNGQYGQVWSLALDSTIKSNRKCLSKYQEILMGD